MKKYRRINSIDIMRLIFAISVVAIHTHPFLEHNELISYIFSEVIGRIAVPFFFLISGYFFMMKLKNNNTEYKVYLISIVSTYLIWNLIYLLYKLVFVIYNKESIIAYLKNNIVNYLILGSNYHLWYFPVLILCIIVSVYVIKNSKEKLILPITILLFLIGVLGSGYYKLGINIPILYVLYNWKYYDIVSKIILGLTFFLLGGMIKIHEKYISKFKFKSILNLVIISIIYCLEIIIINYYDIQRNIIMTISLYPLVFCIILWCLNNPLEWLNEYNKKIRGMANFLYYSHPIIISIIQNIMMILGKDLFNGTTEFILSIIISNILVMIIINSNNKIMNRYFLTI